MYLKGGGGCWGVSSQKKICTKNSIDWKHKNKPNISKFSSAYDRHVKRGRRMRYADVIVQLPQPAAASSLQHALRPACTF